MNRSRFACLALLSSLAFAGCSNRDSKMTPGAAAGAGIGALLGVGQTERQDAASGNAATERAADEGGPRYFGPLR